MTKLYLISSNDFPNPARPVGVESSPHGSAPILFEEPEACGIMRAALAGLALFLVACACMVVL